MKRRPEEEKSTYPSHPNLESVKAALEAHEPWRQEVIQLWEHILIGRCDQCWEELEPFLKELARRSENERNR